ncbi:MAG: beta-lactamase family protein [Acidobacteria bacterium]|nr:beta-lactamase family protein [Acidobacteriota bacterium]
MSDLPRIEPRYAPQPLGLAWPTHEWASDVHSLDPVVREIADRAFDDPAVAETRTVLVVQHGKIVYERYAGSLPSFIDQGAVIDKDTTQISWSMAKSMTHFFTGILIDEQRLTLDEPVRIPEWSSDGRSAITLRHLLSMRDGLEFVEDYLPDHPSDVIAMLFGEGQNDVAGYTIARPLAHTPGEVWNYSSGTTNIICRILADAVGPGSIFHDFMNQRLFEPLGMRSAVPKFDARGTFIGSSYVYATARDFARFGYLYLRGGEWDGRQLVSREWCDTAQIPLSRDDESGAFYSLQWWVTGDEFGSYWANGYEGQLITVVPTLDAVIVRLGATDATRYPALRNWRNDLLHAMHHADH